MQYRTWYIVSSMFLSTCSLLSTQLPRKLLSALHSMNALTTRAINQPPRGITATTIEQLVRTIYLQNSVPPHTLLLIGSRYFMVQRGIEINPDDSHIFIFSRGYAKTIEPGTNDDFIQRGGAAKAASIQFEDGIVPDNYPLICFDYDDGREGFAFGQLGEIETLQKVFDAVIYKNPSAAITLVGDCRGAKVALEIATQKPPNLHSLILMAPFISSREITDNIADNHLSYLPYSRTILHQFFKIYFKNYQEEADTLRDRISLIDPQLPILIAHRASDQLVSTETIEHIVSELKNNGNTQVELIISQDQSEPHSKLTGLPEIQRGIAEFIKKHFHSSNSKIDNLKQYS